MEVFSDYAYYYNAFYSDKDYAGEARMIDSMIQKYSAGKKLMNFGCGTGKHDAQLYKMGYCCSGVDMSEQMIQQAKKNLPTELQDQFSVADIREYEAKETVDCVISLFHVMSYQNTDKDIMAAFSAARKALDKGGLFIFDSWYGPGVLSDKPSIRVREVEDELNRIIRIARPVMHEDKNIVDVCYEILVINKETSVVRTINEVHSMRYFFRPEIERLLSESGFRLIECLDCRTMGATDFDTWTSYFIAVAE